jgi:hypothetical protein
MTQSTVTMFEAKRTAKSTRASDRADAVPAVWNDDAMTVGSANIASNGVNISKVRSMT